MPAMAARASMDAESQDEDLTVDQFETGMTVTHGPDCRHLLGLDSSTLRSKSNPASRRLCHSHWRIRRSA
jgi:hypothetical protein